MEKRNQNSKHFRNADGTFTAQIGRNVHYLDAKGEWQNINLSIANGTSYAGYAFRNETNEVKSYFPTNPGKNGVMMHLEDGIDFTWWGNPALRFTLNNEVTKSMAPNIVRGSANGKKLTYPGIYTGMSEEFMMLENGMESNTIIHSLSPAIRQLPGSAMLEFEHFVSLKKDWQVLADGNTQTKDFNAEQLFIRIPGLENGIHFGRIVVFDNNISKNEALMINMPSEKLSADQRKKLDQSVHKVSYKVQFVDNGIKIITQLPASWLQAPSRTFPVTIDPVVTITPVSAVGTFYTTLSHWYGYQRHANLYLQSEIGAFGSITQIEYNSTDNGTAGSRPTKVFMRTIAANILSSSAWNSTTYTGDATLCLDENTDQGNTLGWKALSLSTPFNYDQDNLLIMVSDMWGGSGATKYYNSSSTVTGRQAYNRQDGTDPGDGVSMIVEDRLPEIRITYVPSTPCSGTPSIGTAVASVADICPESPFTLDLSGASFEGGITYQWQSSTDGGTTWADLGSGQTSPSYIVTSQSIATSYRVIATCTNSSLSDTSNVVSVAQNDITACYCLPTINFNCTDGDLITNVTFGSINNTTTCGDPVTGYTNYSSSIPPAQVEVGTTVPISVSVGPSGAGWLYESVGIWIDFNQNGVLDSAENEFTNLGSGLNEALTGNIVIPADALPGTTRMRVVVAASRDMRNAFVCGPLNNNENFGEMEDYSIIILPAQKDITAVTDLADVNLQCPTLFDDLNLPASVEVTYEDETTEDIPVTWQEGNYEPATGTYTLVGTLDLPAHTHNTQGLTASIIVIVEDATDPEITCLSDIFANTDDESCTYTHNGTSWDATATDNCTAAPSLEYILTGATAGTGTTLDGVIFNLGETTVTWTATDGAGNINVCSFVVTVVDETAPTILTRNLIVALNANGQANITPEMIDNNSNDACGIATLELDKETFGLSNLGLNTVTLTVTDNNGNQALATATVVVVAFNDGSFIYDGSQKSVSITGDLPSGVSVSYVNNVRTDVGKQTATATINGGSNYNDLILTAELAITTDDITGITFNNGSFIYDGSEKSLTISGDLPSGASVIYVNNIRTDAGTQKVTATINGGSNYNDLILTAELTVITADITGITFNNDSFIYDGSQKALKITESLPSGASVSYANNSRTNAGTQTVTATINGGGNYNDLVLTAELTIAKADITGITFNNASFIYDGSEKSISIMGSLPSVASISYTNNSLRDAGTQTATATIHGGNNYNDLVLTAELTIAKADITGITFNNASFIYDGSEKSMSIMGSLPSVASISYTNNSLRDAGTQTATATIHGGNNYNDLVLTAKLTITPAQRSITFPAIADKTYGDAAFAAGASASTGEPIVYSSSNPSVATVSTNGQITIQGAGQVTITATLTENANHSDNPVTTRSFTVAKSHQNISQHNIPTSLPRNTGTLPVSVSASSGLEVSLSLDDEQVATLSGNTLNIHRLGTVRITLSQGGNENYHAADPITVSMYVEDPASDFKAKVHPALSPNGDGINDFLIIEGIRDYPDNRVILYTRNGLRIYEVTGYNNDDVAFRGIGKSGGMLPMGTYFYTVEIKVNGSWQQRKGYFVLKY